MTGIQCRKHFANGFLSSEHNELAKRKEANAVCRRAGIFFFFSSYCRQDQLRSKAVTAAAMTPPKGNLSPRAVVLGEGRALTFLCFVLEPRISSGLAFSLSFFSFFLSLSLCLSLSYLLLNTTHIMAIHMASFAL